MISAVGNILNPTLAIDGGAIGIVVFLVISFISWIMNTVQAAKQQQEAKQRQAARRRPAGQPQQPRGQAGGGRARSEIEEFLEEVTAQKRQQPERSQQRPRPPRPPKRPSRSQQKPAPKRPLAKQGPKEPTAELGSKLKEHVSSYMSDRISDHVDQDINRPVSQHITEHVYDHIGGETDDQVFDSIDGPEPNPAAKAIREMLSDGEGVRRAILVNEILSRRTFKQ